MAGDRDDGEQGAGMGGVVATVIPVWFRTQMTRLMGLKFAPIDLLTHWEALRDLPPGVLEAAVTLAQRTRVDFPTPIELRRDADQARPVDHDGAELDRSEELPAPIALGTLPSGHHLPPVTRVWNYYCDRCNDTGRESFWCGANRRQPWLTIRECETFKCKSIKAGHAEYGHEWVETCPCADVNPAVARKRERDAKYAAQGGRKS